MNYCNTSMKMTMHSLKTQKIRITMPCLCNIVVRVFLYSFFVFIFGSIPYLTLLEKIFSFICFCKFPQNKLEANLAKRAEHYFSENKRVFKGIILYQMLKNRFCRHYLPLLLGSAFQVVMYILY